MSLDENTFGQNPFEEKLIRSELFPGDPINGPTFSFASEELKNQMENLLTSMDAKSKRIHEEGYKCGHCAAFPCYRRMASEALVKDKIGKLSFELSEEAREEYEAMAKEEAQRRAGLCFQHVRLCRQECGSYKYPIYEDKASAPAQGGVCKVTGKKVYYEQECHVKENKKSKL